MSNIKLQQTQLVLRLVQDKIHFHFLQDTQRTHTPMKNHATHSVFANCHILPLASVTSLLSISLTDVAV